MKPGKKQLCYDSLRQKVLTLDLAPGAMLDETALASEHGAVSHAITGSPATAGR